MTKRIAVGAIFCATLCIGTAYASAFVSDGPHWGAGFMVVGLATMLVALMALGAARGNQSLSRLVWPLTFTFTIVVVVFGAALLLPAEGAQARLFWGLPLRAALVLYGLGALPILVLPLCYALTFDGMTLSDDDLGRVRALGAAYRHASRPDAT